MVWPEAQPDHMRHNQAHEADETCVRDGDGDHHRGQQERDAADAVRLNTNCARLVVAERHGVQRNREGTHENRSHQSGQTGEQHTDAARSLRAEPVNHSHND